MERAGQRFAIVSNPCYRGHYLRSHKGHCIQCDTSRIAFVNRHYKEAYVYLVGSRIERVFKIGSSESPWDRGPHLNHIGYGGITDWDVLYYAQVKDAGKVEFAVHSELAGHVSPRKWVREGLHQVSKEIFACAWVTARAALTNAIGDDAKSEWEAPSAYLRYRFSNYLSSA